MYFIYVFNIFACPYLPLNKTRNKVIYLSACLLIPSLPKQITVEPRPPQPQTVTINTVNQKPVSLNVVVHVHDEIRKCWVAQPASRCVYETNQVYLPVLFSFRCSNHSISHPWIIVSSMQLLVHSPVLDRARCSHQHCPFLNVAYMNHRFMYASFLCSAHLRDST